MTEWKKFQTTAEAFRAGYVNGVWDENAKSLEEAQVAYAEYMEHTRCGVCHQKLQIGDEFDLRPIQTVEERGDSPFTSQAVIVHRKCVA